MTNPAPELPGFYSSFCHELVISLTQQPAHVAGHFVAGELPARLDELGVLASDDLGDDAPCMGPLIKKLLQHALGVDGGKGRSDDERWGRAVGKRQRSVA